MQMGQIALSSLTVLPPLVLFPRCGFSFVPFQSFMLKYLLNLLAANTVFCSCFKKMQQKKAISEKVQMKDKYLFSKLHFSDM